MKRTNQLIRFALVSGAFFSLVTCAGCGSPAVRPNLWAGTINSGSLTGPITEKIVRYHIYLPADYHTDNERYPVIYHLHGLGGSEESDNDIVVGGLENAIDAGVIRPAIVIFASGYDNSMWADSKDGKKPAETNVIRELIPHIDSTYRTLASREYRVIQGMSMGGYGAVEYAVKFPEVFSVCINYDGALHNWDTLSSRRKGISGEIFNNDEDYFKNYSPWHNAAQNAKFIRSKVAIRMVVGALRSFNRRYRNHLKKLNIGVDYVQTECDHDLECLFEETNSQNFAFITQHLGQRGGMKYSTENKEI